MREELERFVASLAIPADRKAVVLAELADHVACAREAAAREGREPEKLDLEALRRALEAVEAGFRISRLRAIGHGLVAATIVALVLDQGGPLMRGVLGAIVAIAVAVVLAPPRALDLLRADLRAPRVPGLLPSVPIGPALAYAFTVLSTPFVIWIAMIVVRAIGGDVAVDVPWSAFALMTFVYGVLLVEGVRAKLARA